MDKKKMMEIIFKYIKTKGCVSFVEIENLFDKYDFNYKGDLMLFYSGAPNIIVWGDWNEEAIEIIKELRKNGIKLYSANPLIYYIDGKAFNLPIAKSLKGYKNEVHWLPAVMN